MVSIRIGRYWFLNGHLFVERTITSVSGGVRWRNWACVFCKRGPHEL